MLEDLIAQIPSGWDWNIGTHWDEATGATVYGATLMQRAASRDPDENHQGHYLGDDIECEGASVAAALADAIQKAKERLST